MKKLVLLGIVLMSLLAGPVCAQQLNTPVQRNPINSDAEAPGSNSVTVVIPGVVGQRVRIYSVIIWCGGAALNLAPAIRIWDGISVVFFAAPSVVDTTQDHPVSRYPWIPGLTMPSGSTVEVIGNVGNACTQGSFMTVQADQF